MGSRAASRGGLLAALLAVLGCSQVEALVSGQDEHEDPAAQAEKPAVESDSQSAPPRELTVAAVDPGLGSAVASRVPEPATPQPGPLGGDLELLDPVKVSVSSAGWVEPDPASTTGRGHYGYYGGHMQGASFEVQARVEVTEDPGLNQARLLAKATCLVGDERRASSADVMAEGGGPSGIRPLSLEVGEHEKTRANLFTVQDVVGHTPCQLEFRVVSPFSDKPLRVAGTWCVRDGQVQEEPCAELAPPEVEDGVFAVSDWKVDRSRRLIDLTVTLNDRVWLDRFLVVRSSCDYGGERLARVQFGQMVTWGLLDPGDSVRLQLQNWQGWFGAKTPCELTAEWWQQDDSGTFHDRQDLAVACVERFLPQPGRCPETPPAKGDTPLSVRKFEPTLVRDRRMGGRMVSLVAEAELVAHEDLDGRYRLEVKGHCGEGRRAREVWMSPELNIDPAMLKAGEIGIGSFRGWLHRGGKTCELNMTLKPRGTSSGEAIDLGTWCLDQRGPTDC